MNLIDKLIWAKQILDNNDVKELTANIGKFMPLYEEIKRNVTRYAKDYSHKVCFCASDLVTLSASAKIVLNSLNNKINVDKMMKEIGKNEIITDAVMKDFTYKYTDIYYVVGRLTEFHSVMTYLSVLLSLYERYNDSQELDEVMLDVIRGFLR